MNLNQSDWLDNYEDLFEEKPPSQLLLNPLLQKDIWHTVDDLNLKISPHQKVFTLNFKTISLDWFRLLVKLYILVKAKPNQPSTTINGFVIYLRGFSKFLAEKHINNPKQIDNEVFEQFDYYLIAKGLKDSSLGHYRTTVCNLFDVCRIEGWIDVNTYWFRGKRNRVHPKNDEVDYIPEKVWHQLEENLYYLPEPIQRMILVIKTTGIRGGELLNLPLDCLRKRGEQWRLRLTTEKYNIDDEIPIAVPELVAVIKEQQEYIKQIFGDEFGNLFCSNHPGHHRKDGTLTFSPNPKVMTTSTFNLWLNRLAQKADIQTSEGAVYKFKSHQFRRTVGTVMTNAGVRDLIAQKYLRHRSPDMLPHYQHLLKQTLGDEFEELIKDQKYHDISGKIVETIKASSPITEFIRRKMYPLTTQYGECHRPILKSPCHTVNACWRCEHWRITEDDFNYLKEDLARVEEELQIARTLRMTRQTQGLESDRNNLLAIIQGIEESR